MDREGHLPTTEQPTNKWADLSIFFRRAQEVVLKFPASASAVGRGIPLRLREVFEKVRGRISGPFDDRGRRCSGKDYLPDRTVQILTGGR